MKYTPIILVISLNIFAVPCNAQKPFITFKDCDRCPEMVVVPAGIFLMGSSEDELSRAKWESPQHKVTYESAYAIGKYEVTFEELEACVEGGECIGSETGDHGMGGSRQPVNLKTWQEASAYAEWLTEITGRRYRLPTEAEWEYAARSGTTTPFSTGSTISSEQANFDGTRPYGHSPPSEFRQQTLAVGSFPANAYGIHDMHGNVSEYVADCWIDSYENAHPLGVAWQSGDCKYRVLRGGHWQSSGALIRSATRTRIRPDYRRSRIGFRVAAEVN